MGTIIAVEGLHEPTRSHLATTLARDLGIPVFAPHVDEAGTVNEGPVKLKDGLGVYRAACTMAEEFEAFMAHQRSFVIDGLLAAYFGFVAERPERRAKGVMSAYNAHAELFGDYVAITALAVVDSGLETTSEQALFVYDGLVEAEHAVRSGGGSVEYFPPDVYSQEVIHRFNLGQNQSSASKLAVVT